MLRLDVSPAFALVATVAVTNLVVDSRDARACGGCFHPPPSPQEVETSLVTDHRMAFALSPAQTVLWDQIRYSGNPKDFAWVLPVRPGARIELSHDAWIAALDASTETVITGPTPNCPGAAPAVSRGGGCMAGFGASSNAGIANAGPDATGEGPVQVVSQEVVGPYFAVTVRSTQGEALGAWLRANGYDLPLSIQPVVDAYSSEGFDFIALKLAPSQNVQAMQPVRVVSPGADPALPLRMVAAGIGAQVGLELYVLSEGRYHPANFPDATVDFSKLAWDPTSSRSNYAELSQQSLAANGGTGWLTESSQPAVLNGFSGLNPGLAMTYNATCSPTTFYPTCGAASSDAGPADGTPADDAGSAPDAVADALPPPESGALSSGDGQASTCPPPVVAACDDLSLAMTGMVGGSLWVTRLQSQLPAAALTQDLVLEATASQATVSNTHHTDTYTIPNYDPCKSSSNASPSASTSSGGSGCRTAASREVHADAAEWCVGLIAVLLSFGRRRPRRARADRR
jgi:hypothetical protein